MSSITLQDNTVISDYGFQYFVAEVNSSHNGNTETAKKMIDAAVNAGFNCVKFQSWSINSLYSKSYYKENPIAKRFVDRFSMTPDQLKEMAKYCMQKGIGFSSTPYSKEEVDFLVEECNVPFIKIASMEINNLDILRYIGEKQVSIVLSTGMAEMEEIRLAIKVLESSGNKRIALLHCVSIYPSETKTINLNNIIGLRDEFPEYPIGFSDHTLGDIAAIGATALGAAIIEKHITLDSKKIGMDNSMAMEPDDLKVLIDRCRMVNIALGSKKRMVLEKEYNQRKIMRRSIIATRDIPSGTILIREDLAAKRPGTGIPPENMEKLIGKKVNRDIEEDTLIFSEDIKE